MCQKCYSVQKFHTDEQMKTAWLIPVLTQIMQDFKGSVGVVYSLVSSTTHIHPAFTLRL